MRERERERERESITLHHFVTRVHLFQQYIGLKGRAGVKRERDNGALIVRVDCV